MVRRRWFLSIGAAALALGLGALGLHAARGGTDDDCCCVTNDQGKLVCTITDEVLEDCCCN